MSIGGDEYFRNGLCIIEWGEIISSILPEDTIFVKLTRDDVDESVRIITIEGINY